MVAEKPSIAKDIYKALSGKPIPNSKGKSVNFSFNGKFFHHEAYFIVKAVKGHVFQRDFPKIYSNWEKTNPYDLFDAETIKSSCDSGGTVKGLKRIAKGCDAILLWLDNDREGENISFEILDTIYSSLNQSTFQ